MDRKNWRPLLLAGEDVLAFASDSSHHDNEARAKRRGQKMQNTTIIMTKDEVGMKGNVGVINLKTFRRRSELDTISKISMFIEVAFSRESPRNEMLFLLVV